MGMTPKETKFVVDAALVDTGSSNLSTIGLELLPGAKVANMRNMQPIMGNEKKKIAGIGTSKVFTQGTLMFYFLFGGKEYKVKLYILPGCTPLIFSHKDFDKFGLNYSSLAEKHSS